MGPAERRYAILKKLCRQRYEKISALAEEFQVSERTIRRDIEIMSATEPIYTQSGRNGGVFVLGNYSIDHVYMNNDEIALLKRIASLQDTTSGLFSQAEKLLLHSIIRTYEKPMMK